MGSMISTIDYLFNNPQNFDPSETTPQDLDILLMCIGTMNTSIICYGTKTSSVHCTSDENAEWVSSWRLCSCGRI